MDSAYIKFNGGIWSEQLKGRYDLGNYKSAARTCENFIPTRYGQVEKRAGTKHLGYAKNNDKVCVLHSFQFSVNTKFMLEFGDLYIRFWSNDLQVESGGSPLEVVTPYLEADLYELQIRAVNDVVYIVHPDYPVGKLTRLADDNWTYAAADLSLPFVDPDVNSIEVTLTPDALTGSIGIVASADAFNADHVGSELRLKYLTETSSSDFSQKYIIDPDTYDSDTYNANDDIVQFNATAASGTYTVSNASGKTRVWDDPVSSLVRIAYAVVQDFTYAAWSAGTYAVDDLASFGGAVYICTVARTPSDTSDPATDTSSWTEVDSPEDAPSYFRLGCLALSPQTVTGEWSIQTTGTWRGNWLIQRSVDGGTNWSTIRSLSSANDANYLVEEDEEGETAQIRVLGASYNDGGASSSTVTFTALSAPSYGQATITTVTDAQNVVATVTGDMPSTGTAVSWQESAFSVYQGYPRTVALFDNRLLFAGTKKKPQAFFYSEINGYDNFLAATTLADAPFFVETLSEDQSAVQWVTAQRELFVGTASVEGVLTTRKQDEAQSAENLPIVRWNESMGSAHRAALPLRDSLLVLQRGRTVLNMLAYSIDKDGYTGEEVSLLCPHLFSSGVLQMAHLREPYTGVFTVQEDGTVCHMVYEPKLQVTGWCKYTTQGGNFESIQALPSSGNESTDEDEIWCVVKRTINGVTRRHIEHFTVGNRNYQRDDNADNVWHVDAGLKFTGTDLLTITGLDHLEGETVCVLADGIKGSYIVSGNQITLTTAADTVIVGLPVVSTFEPFDLETADSAGRRKQLYQSKLMVWKSLGGSLAVDGKDYQDLVYHVSGETMDESVPLKDGYMEVFHESSYSRQKYWRIKHYEPHPFTLQAVIQSFTVSKG